MTRFVAFGDSITLGEDGVTTLAAAPKTLTEAFASPMQILVGLEYPTVLQKALAARYSLQSIVMHNEGLRGERASLGPLRFGTVLASRLPQAVLIMEGSNDIFDGSTTAIDPAITGLRSMITTAKSRGVRPYLATVPPMNPAGPRGRLGYATVPLLNARIKALAELEAVTLVDINLAFNGNFAYLAADGLHPNASGFELIGQTFFTALRDSLEVSPPALAPLPSPVPLGLR